MPIRRRDVTAWLAWAAGWPVCARPAPRVIRLAMQNPPGSAQHDAALHMADIVKARSGGRLEIKVFGAGSLGKDVALVSALQGGTVEMALMSASLLSGVVKQMSVFDLPFSFASAGELYAVVDGPFGKRMHALLEAKGLVGLNYWEAGSVHFLCGKRPITHLEDLQGLKVRAIETPVAIDFLAALGANPVPVPFPELYNALEQRVVDCATLPLVALLHARLFEVQKYVSLSDHMMLVQSLLFSQKAWRDLGPEERSLLQEAADEARGVVRRLANERHARTLTELQAQGMVINRLPASELARMRVRTQAASERHARLIGEETVAAQHAAIVQVRTRN